MAQFKLFTIAEGFPPGLNTASPPTDLKYEETPDGYGFNLAVDGVLASGTIPSGTARIQKSLSIGGNTWYWHYNRAWRISSNLLYYNAPNYDAAVMPQGLGKLTFQEDAESFVVVLPVAPDGLCLLKPTGGYIVSNCSDSRAFFQRTDLIQELKCAAANRAVELDGVVYVSNDYGLISYANETKELTRKVRDDLTNFKNVALVADHEKHRIIGGTTFVYDLETQKIFRYSSSSFRYTTPQIRRKDYEPWAADRMLFVVEHATAVNGSLTYQVKYEDGDWGHEYTVKLQSVSERYTVIPETLEKRQAARRFQLRITSLSSNKYIKKIMLDIANFSQDDYST